MLSRTEEEEAKERRFQFVKMQEEVFPALIAFLGRA